MNILMKKELEDQSKHAEKLLEINQNIYDSRNDLKQELELSRSMQHETNERLTMYQRMIKQLNEKVKFMEDQTDKEDQDYRAALEKKTQEIGKLQASLGIANKRLSKENSKVVSTNIFNKCRLESLNCLHSIIILPCINTSLINSEYYK